MTILVESDPTLVQEISALLPDDVVTVDSLDELDTYLVEHPNEAAVVLGSSVPMNLATRFADSVRIARPATSVILVRKRMDSSMLATSMRSGVRDVVAVRDLSQLVEAVRRAQALAAAMRTTSPSSGEDGDRSGTLITVFSTKGGVGKSTIATNLAAAIQTLNKRVCIVDLDVQGGDVAIMLQLLPIRSLSDIEGLGGVIDTSGVLSLLTTHDSGVSVLAAPLNLEARDSVSPEQVAKVLQVLKTAFDVIVVDTSPAFDDLGLSAFDHSDYLVLVGTLDIPALKNLKMATGTLDLLSMPRSQWRLVLNRADAKVGLAPAEFQRTLGLTISASIPTSRDVLASVNRGETLVASQPRHPVSVAITDLARNLVQDDSTPAGTGRESRFFRRLRRVNKQ